MIKTFVMYLNIVVAVAFLLFYSIKIENTKLMNFSFTYNRKISTTCELIKSKTLCCNLSV
jgi:hypothetical protein